MHDPKIPTYMQLYRLSMVEWTINVEYWYYIDVKVMPYIKNRKAEVAPWKPLYYILKNFSSTDSVIIRIIMLKDIKNEWKYI